jgi:4-hydroxy-2-oxoheptanedioate aldolase
MDLGNRVKERLQAGERVVGCFVPIPSPELVELCALSGFDFVLLDAEHGPISPTTAYPMILAAEAQSITPLARIGQLDRQVILKFLDLGIAGVMIPQVNDGAAAEDAVAALRFPPRGRRGIAGSRAFDFGNARPPSERVPVLNDRILSMVQFENVTALDHLDEILRTPDLDMLFVGPNDLAASMGYAGQPGHPEVTRLVDEQVIPLAKKHGKSLGTVAVDGASAAATFNRGFDMVVAGASALFGAGARDYLKKALA